MRSLLLFSLVVVAACDNGGETGGEGDRIDDVLSLSADSVAGLEIYTARSCGGCHGADGMGTASFPSLVETLPENSDRESLEVIIDGGSGMPSSADLADQELADLLAYINSEFG